MSIARATPDVSGEGAGNRRIEYLSKAAPVNMGDWWFDVAGPDHFWIKRRFDVMRRLAGPYIQADMHIAEIGCGNGLVQRGIEDYYGIPVSGFELNEVALKKNVSRISPLYCYDIHHRNAQFAAHFDLVLLFDVLEHIEDEGGFLQSLKFHLPDSGLLVINVPAHRFFYSNYDRAAGHVRRYSSGQLEQVLENNGFKVKHLTYWGLPLVPLLLLRKAISLSDQDGSSGFDPRGRFLNSMLGLLARMEPIPQRLLGTSVMAVAENVSSAGTRQT